MKMFTDNDKEYLEDLLVRMAHHSTANPKKEIDRKAVFDGMKKDDGKRSYVNPKNKKFSIER